MTIYIDSDFRCHTTETDAAVQSVQTSAFGGKCAAYIEGYRYIPEGQEWTRDDGVIFQGPMAAPWKDYGELDAAQRDYERLALEVAQAEAAALRQALDELDSAYAEGVNSV